LTQKIEGQAAHLFLRNWVHCGDHRSRLAAKRAGLRSAAEAVRRFHQNGFVHGDLVASNIFVSGTGEELILYFMDNDRTRRYPTWVPQSLWTRNLIQLNRMPLPGITLQDRMRFFKSYLGIQKLTAGERRFAHWLERNTRRRRQECDGVDASGDFRKLMRWREDFRGARDVKKA
jgi:Ser/Thr protein kinase RdoA (MazF antagonist)